MERTALLAPRLMRAPVIAALVALALLALAPSVAAAQQFPVRRQAEPPLLSGTVFTGIGLTPGQWQAGTGLRVRVSRFRFEPAIAYGQGLDYSSVTGWATLSLLLGETPGLDSYVGAGAAYYRERSDAAGVAQTRALWAPAFVAGVESDLLGIGLFAEVRLLNAEYAGDDDIAATDVGVTSLVAGIWLPF